jgi:hypothetical protein
MLDIDIVMLIKSSLRSKGCDESLLSDFDGNSTIALEFHDSPSILISLINTHVVIWAQLQEHNSYVLAQCASSLLEIIMDPFRHSVTGHLNLSENEGMTTLECFVHPESINEEDFAEALEIFYIQTQRVVEALR